jgi:hypothetical protein
MGRVRKPGCYSSPGYAGQTVLDHRVVDVDYNSLQKAFTLTQWANKVRAMLDCSPNSVPAHLEETVKHR